MVHIPRIRGLAEDSRLRTRRQSEFWGMGLAEDDESRAAIACDEFAFDVESNHDFDLNFNFDFDINFGFDVDFDSQLRVRVWVSMYI